MVTNTKSCQAASVSSTFLAYIRSQGVVKCTYLFFFFHIWNPESKNENRRSYLCVHAHVYVSICLCVLQLWQPARVMAASSWSSTPPVPSVPHLAKTSRKTMTERAFTSSTWRTVCWLQWRRNTSSALCTRSSQSPSRSWCQNSSWQTSLHGNLPPLNISFYRLKHNEVCSTGCVETWLEHV